MMYNAGCLLIAATCIMRLFYVPDPLLIAPLAMGAWLVAWWWHRPFLRLTPLDLCLTAIWAYMALTPGVNQQSSTEAAMVFGCNLLAYFLVRCLTDSDMSPIINKAATLCHGIFIVLAIAMAQYAIFVSKVHQAGFTSVYNFRFLYTPLGVPVNEWNSLLWLWGGLAASTFCVKMGRWTRLAAGASLCLSLAMAVLSFSRGNYIAIAVFAVAAFFYLRRRCLMRNKRVTVAIALAIIAVAGASFSSETSQTLRMNATASQRQSTAGRADAIGLTAQIMAEHPWGVGAGNYTMAKDYYQSGDARSDNYTSFAPSIVTQVLVEAGLGGVLLLLAALATFVWIVIIGNSPWHRLMSIFLMGFWIKELTFPTFFTSPTVQLFALAFMGYICPRASGQYTARNKLGAVIPSLFMAWLAWAGLYYKDHVGSQSLTKYSILDSERHYRDAVTYRDTVALKRLADSYPDKLRYRWTLCQWLSSSGKYGLASVEFATAILRQPRILETDTWKQIEMSNPQLAAMVKNKLRQALATRPASTINQAKLGSVALHIGDIARAEKYLSEAARQMPGLSRVWSNLANISESKGDAQGAALYRKRYNLTENGILGGRDAILPERQADITPLLDGKIQMLHTIWYRTQPLH